MFTILNDKNVSTYLIGDFMSVKAVVHGTHRIWFIFSTILYKYTQEESSHNTVNFFWGGYLSRCSFLTNTNRSEKVSDHFHVTFCLCLSVFISIFLYKKTHQFLHLLPHETFCLVRHFLSDCRNPRSGLLTNLGNFSRSSSTYS